MDSCRRNGQRNSMKSLLRNPKLVTPPTVIVSVPLLTVALRCLSRFSLIEILIFDSSLSIIFIFAPICELIMLKSERFIVY